MSIAIRRNVRRAGAALMAAVVAAALCLNAAMPAHADDKQKELENKKKAAKNQKEADTIQANLIAVEDAQAWNAGSCCQYFNHHRVRFPK